MADFLHLFSSLRATYHIIAYPQRTITRHMAYRELGGSRVFARYVLPMSFICAACNCISKILMHTPPERSIVQSIFLLMSLHGGFYITYFIIKLLMKKAFASSANNGAYLTAAAILMSIVFVVRLFEAFIPDAFIIKVFYAYILYLGWHIGNDILPLTDKSRANFMVLMAFVTIAAPSILLNLLFRFVPGL